MSELLYHYSGLVSWQRWNWVYLLCEQDEPS